MEYAFWFLLWRLLFLINVELPGKSSIGGGFHHRFNQGKDEACQGLFEGVILLALQICWLC